MRPFFRASAAVLLTVALLAGLASLVRVANTEKGRARPDLAAYASVICEGIAGPANSYRAMFSLPTVRGQSQNVVLKNWYTTYLNTMGKSTDSTVSSLNSFGAPGERELSAPYRDLVNFFGDAQRSVAAGKLEIAAMSPTDPQFNAKIDQVTGGAIAPERFDKLLATLRANAVLDAAMGRSAGCQPAVADLRLVVQGRMLDLFSGTHTT